MGKSGKLSRMESPLEVEGQEFFIYKPHPGGSSKHQGDCYIFIKGIINTPPPKLHPQEIRPY